jgi:hypothetical protein
MKRGKPMATDTMGQGDEGMDGEIGRAERSGGGGITVQLASKVEEQGGERTKLTKNMP